MTARQKAISMRALDLMERDHDLPMRAAVALAEVEDEYEPDVMGYVRETTKHLDPAA